MTIEKKQETNGIIIRCSYVWQSMVNSMICLSSQSGLGNNHLSFLDKIFSEILGEYNGVCLKDFLQMQQKPENFPFC